MLLWCRKSSYTASMKDCISLPYRDRIAYRRDSWRPSSGISSGNSSFLNTSALLSLEPEYVLCLRLFPDQEGPPVSVSCVWVFETPGRPIASQKDAPHLPARRTPWWDGNDSHRPSIFRKGCSESVSIHGIQINAHSPTLFSFLPPREWT